MVLVLFAARALLRACLRLAPISLALFVFASALRAQGGPPPEVREAIDAVVQFLISPEGASRSALVARLSPTYRASFAGEPELMAHLDRLRGAAGGGGGVRVEGDDEGLLLRLGDVPGGFRVGLDDAAQITRLALAEAAQSSGGGQGGLGSYEEHALAIEELALGGDRMTRFRDERLTPEFVSSLSSEELDELLAHIGRLAAGAGGVNYLRDVSGFIVRFEGSVSGDVVFEIEPEEPFRIVSLAVVTPERNETAMDRITWETLDARLQEAEALGFAGRVLAVHNGREVLNRGYGVAAPATGRTADANTAYDIGSIPIDFTRAATFLLLQRGELALDDSITRFFEDVPDDKKAITIRHLLTGMSGLANFHHRPEDADRDLTWIDRETAERRILAGPLLFSPGEQTSHSHSGYGLLAAVVERTTGLEYAQFLEREFFGPAGMTRTGLYGDARGLPAEAFAVGSGGSVVGDPNIPPNWGPTSWLVMGSGGMYSHPEDLRRWFETLRSGRILQGEALELYLRRGHALGGTDRGFLFMHAWDRADTMIFLAQNAGTDNPALEGLIRQLLALVEDDGDLIGP